MKSVFGTKEWAKYVANACCGCHNDCNYCYAKTSAIKRGSKTPENWCDEIIYSKALHKKWEKKDGTIMFPSQHDITLTNIDICITMLKNILEPGNNVLIVSKPKLKCIERLCEELKDYKDNILFRFTIGSVNDETLKLWEPKAPGFQERLSSLIYAYENGYRTSVSSEPMLDENIDDVIKEVSPYITDAIWLGKMNYPYKRLETNGHKDMFLNAKKLVDFWNDQNVINLYERYKNNPLIKWKESIKKVVGLEIPVEEGLDK